MKFRTVVGAMLLALAVATVIVVSRVALAGLAAVGLCVHTIVSGGIRRSALLVTPVLVFAALLALLQWFAGSLSVALPLKTIAIFLFVTAAVRLLPWTDFMRVAGPQSSLFTLVLFLYFLRHFTLILGREAYRLLVARRRMVPNQYGPGWFQSLCWALVELFRRSLSRAERFYAAQSLRGWSE
jgi:hypothetical protein